MLLSFKTKSLNFLKLLSCTYARKILTRDTFSDRVEKCNVRPKEKNHKIIIDLMKYIITCACGENQMECYVPTVPALLSAVLYVLPYKIT